MKSAVTLSAMWWQRDTKLQCRTRSNFSFGFSLHQSTHLKSQ